MPEQITEKILDHIPKKAPSWAIGITTVIVSVFMSLLSIYLFASSDIRQIIGWAEDHHNSTEIAEIKRHEESDVIRARQYSDALDVVSKLVISNGVNITDIAKSLGAAQQQNIILSDRVSILEKKVSEIKEYLIDCQKKLAECEKAHK